MIRIQITTPDGKTTTSTVRSSTASMTALLASAPGCQVYALCRMTLAEVRETLARQERLGAL